MPGSSRSLLIAARLDCVHFLAQAGSQDGGSEGGTVDIIGTSAEQEQQLQQLQVNPSPPPPLSLRCVGATHRPEQSDRPLLSGQEGDDDRRGKR